MKRSALIFALGLSCAACGVPSNLPTGPSAYALIPDSDNPPVTETYAIGPLDTINVNVFREPDLSVEAVQVDPNGRLPLPLLGSVKAGGKTADALEQELEQKLAYYLVEPKVSVTVNSITQKVIVEGSVNQPGVFDIRGSASLLEALAMAESPNNRAALDEVFVFRKINGRLQGARFDIRRIRAGLDADPAIIAGDRVVVGLDEVAAGWQDYLGASIFNVFRVF